jgi:hypothetical protein
MHAYCCTASVYQEHSCESTVSSHIGRTGLQGTGGEGETLKGDKTPRKLKILIFMIKNYISYLDYNYNPGFDSFFKILLQNT